VISDSSTDCLLLRRRSCCGQQLSLRGAQLAWCDGSSAEAASGRISNGIWCSFISSTEVDLWPEQRFGCKVRLNSSKKHLQFKKPENYTSPSGLQQTRVAGQECNCTVDNGSEASTTTTAVNHRLKKRRPPVTAVALDLLIASGCASVAIIGVGVWCVARFRRVQLRTERRRMTGSSRRPGMARTSTRSLANFNYRTNIAISATHDTPGQQLIANIECYGFPRPPPYSLTETVEMCRLDNNGIDIPPPYTECELPDYRE
uniref:CUB domain-containing protein n=1 Tax=Macrostomum lignano TaxID=282301 RepID=A0A1I8GYL3_9PLAT